MKSIRNAFLSYLKERNIYFFEDFSEGTPRITMSFEEFQNSPSKRIEACVWFYGDSTLEARVYYAEPSPQIVERSGHLPEIFRLLNYLNARVFVRNADGVENEFYKPSYLLQPRFYMTEDNCFDITAIVVMEGDYFWIAPLEIEDFITAGLPSLLEKLAPYIFGVILGNISVDVGIQYIISVTMNVYTHIGFDDAEEELKRLEDFRKAQAEVEQKKEKPMSQKMFKVI